MLHSSSPVVQYSIPPFPFPLNLDTPLFSVLGLLELVNLIIEMSLWVWLWYGFNPPLPPEFAYNDCSFFLHTLPCAGDRV